MRFGSPFSILLAALAGQSLISGVWADGNSDSNGVDTVDTPVPSTAATPEVLELTGTDFKSKIANGYWLVKHYSPTCIHCQRVAPIWRNVVNKYISTPVATDKIQSFSDAYHFDFASLNCLAYADLCEELGVSSYPTFFLFKDGKRVDEYQGDRSEAAFSAYINQKVELVKKESADAAARKASSATPNPKGESTELDAATFTKFVTLTRDAWLVKFYAPWCGHCQKMAPAWAELGKEMKNQLNVGEVNCEMERRLCKDIKVKGYPTILYFQNGERVEYNGLRGLGDLVKYARQAVHSGVKEIDSAGYKELETKGETEVAFIYFYDIAATSEDFEALDRLTLNLIGRAPIYKSNDPDLAERFRIYTKPKLMVVRDGRPSYYNAISPQDMRDYNKVLTWMKTVWLPLVPELTASNSQEIMNNKIVVLGIFNRENHDEFVQAKKEVKEAAVEFLQQRQDEEQMERKKLRNIKQLRLEEAEDRKDDRGIRAAKNTKIQVSPKKDVGFAWVDGVFWERWVRTTYGVNVRQVGPKVIINDEENKQFWDQTVEGGDINTSRSRILNTLADVTSKHPMARSKSTSPRIQRFFFLTKAHMGRHPWLSTLLILTAIIIGAFWGRGRMRRRSVGFFRLEGKEGILGNNSQGKVD